MEKQESHSSMLAHREKMYYWEELKNLPVKLSEVEKKIIEKRLIGLSFNQLGEVDVRVATDKILLKSSAITGCKLPQTEGFAEIIAEEITSFILDFGYEELTLEEVLMAFKINSKTDLKFPSGVDVQSVVFTGQCMNIDYMSKVLYNYMQFRNILDRKFQNHLDGH